MANSLVTLKRTDLYYKNDVLLSGIDLSINKKENTIITGPSGSGKTLLGRIIAGQLLASAGERIAHTSSIVFVNQQQDFRTAFSQRSYYQSRYEYSNDGDIPTVTHYLEKYFGAYNNSIKLLLTQFGLEYILTEKLTQLSNGEGKRLQLITALAKQPELLILDNPFTGVDKKSRQFLCEIFDTLNEKGITYILLSKTDDIPLSISKIIQLDNGRIADETNREGYTKTGGQYAAGTAAGMDRLLEKIAAPETYFNTVVKLSNVTIQYEDKVVLNNISWQVNRGERWLLRGSNGSGKSMLLSLLNGDNPKAFGKGILLFDKPKGSGETIWELKNKIGYISPEMHIHFLRKPEHVAELVALHPEKLEDAYQPSTTCFEVIASGFNEEIGFVSGITTSQQELVHEWIAYLQVNKYAGKPFYQMPMSLQRLSLLARALVRNPPLLILDEPCQGLDEEQTNLFKETVEHFCNRFGNTLIYVSHYDIDLPAGISNMLELENGNIKYCGKYPV
ncbi:MAG: ATP-binding cassette domain-containing protein [Ferruginibacter sp.]